MQIIKEWPASLKLALPETVKQALLNHLIEQFSDEATAQDFWVECPSTLIIIEASDNVGTLVLIDITTRQQVEFAITNPEYSEALNNDYTINLSIVNDEGAGIYLVINNNSELLHFPN